MRTPRTSSMPAVTAPLVGLVGLLASVPAIAGNAPHYSFLQVAWINVDAEHGGHDAEGDGILVKGSVAAAEHLFVTGEFASVDLDGDDLEEAAIGLGARWPVTGSTDLVAQVAWLREDLEHHGKTHTEEGFKAFAGARSHLTQAFEVEGGLTWIDLADGDAGVLLGARWYPAPIVSIGADLAVNDAVTLVEFGVRVDF